MSSPSQVAAGFTITGLLDGASRTRGRYPVSEIAVADIADHPANAAYSMDPDKWYPSVGTWPVAVGDSAEREQTNGEGMRKDAP